MQMEVHICFMVMHNKSRILSPWSTRWEFNAEMLPRSLPEHANVLEEEAENHDEKTAWNHEVAELKELHPGCMFPVFTKHVGPPKACWFIAKVLPKHVGSLRFMAEQQT